MKKISVAVAVFTAGMLMTGIAPLYAGSPADTPGIKKALPLNDVLNGAISWHPSLKSSYYLQQAAADGADAARADYYPQVSVGLDNRLHDTGDRDGRNTGSDARVTVRQMVYDFGKTAVRTDEAGLIIRREAAGSAKTRDELIYRVSQAYYNTVLYNRLVGIAQEQVRGFAVIEAMAEQRNVSGAFTRADYIQSRNKRIAAQALLTRYETEREYWSARLMHQTNNRVNYGNIPDMPVISPGGSCRDGSGPADVRAAPDVRLAQIDYELAKNHRTAARRDHFPTIWLEGHYRSRLQKDHDSGRDADRREIMLNVDVPLYEGGRRQAMFAKSVNEMAAGRYRYEAALLDAGERQGTALENIRGSEAILPYQAEKMETARQIRDLYFIQYQKLGTRPLIDVLNAEGDIHQSGIDITMTVTDINLMTLDCLYSRGDLIQLAENGAPGYPENP